MFRLYQVHAILATLVVAAGFGLGSTACAGPILLAGFEAGVILQGYDIQGLSFLPLNFPARCGEVSESSGRQFGPGSAIQFDGATQHMAAAICDTPTARARNLRQQLSRMQAFQQSSHRRTATGLVLPVYAEQGGADIAVTEAAGDMVAIENSRKQADFVGASRIEARQTAARLPLRFGQLAQLLVGGGRIVHDG
jgi:hypothetical protein